MKLFCEVTCKYPPVRKTSPSEEKECDCTTQCNCNINGSPNCDISWEEESIDSVCTFTSCESSVSGNSDSIFHVAYEDDDELDDSEDMYGNAASNNKDPNPKYAHHQNMP